MATKSEIRKQLREARRAHVQSLPQKMAGLLFRRPPAPLLDLINHNAKIGLYHAAMDEAPTQSYARFFIEQGHDIALPRFNGANEQMHFARWGDPFGESDLVPGCFNMLEPSQNAPEIIPDVLIMPLLGFTPDGNRIGQGGGHYDRWLADHPQTLAIGLAWDVQLCQDLPIESHDRSLHAIITPTRFYGPFNA